VRFFFNCSKLLLLTASALLDVAIVSDIVATLTFFAILYLLVDLLYIDNITATADCMIVESQVNGDRHLIEIGAFEMTYEKNNPTAESNDKG